MHRPLPHRRDLNLDGDCFHNVIWAAHSRLHLPNYLQVPRLGSLSPSLSSCHLR
jgi:hypothetical protein